MAVKEAEKQEKRADIEDIKARYPGLVGQVKAAMASLNGKGLIIESIMKDAKGLLDVLVQLQNDRMALVMEVKRLEEKREEMKQEAADAYESMNAGHRALVERLSEREKEVAEMKQKLDAEITAAKRTRAEADAILNDAKRRIDGVRGVEAVGKK